MFKKLLLYLILSVILVTAAAYIFQDKKTGQGSDPSMQYEQVKDWPLLPDSIHLGNPTGIGMDSEQHLFIFHRAGRKWPLIGSMPKSFIKENTILMLDNETGRLLNSFGAGMFIMPHGLTVDRENNIWVSDVGLHQVFKFTHNGRLLMTIGEARKPGNDPAHFNRPTDVAVCTDGSFYVSDGYRNSRIVKYSAAGQYLFEWGSKGSAARQFNIPHGIDLDEQGNVYVADRENSRIQVFDSSGKFLRQFSQNNFANICAVMVDRQSDKIYAVDDLSFLKITHRGSDVLVLNDTGTVLTRFGRSGHYTGSTCWYHDVAVDRKGNIFTADIKGNKVQKFVRKV